MFKIWKIIETKKYRSIKHCLKVLKKKKKKIYVSPWIEDVIKNKKK